MPLWTSPFDLYLCRWAGFCGWGRWRKFSPLSAPVLLLEEILLSLKVVQGLSLSAVLVCLAAFSGVFRLRGQEVSSSPELAALVCHFRVGLYAALPFLPPWVLNVVLHALRSPPYEWLR